MCALSTKNISDAYFVYHHFERLIIFLSDSSHYKTDYCRFEYIFYVGHGFYFILVKIYVNTIVLVK